MTQLSIFILALASLLIVREMCKQTKISEEMLYLHQCFRQSQFSKDELDKEYMRLVIKRFRAAEQVKDTEKCNG